MALLPTRISELNPIPPLPDDQIPMARGSGPSGRTYRITVRELIANFWNVADSPTIDFSYDTLNFTLSGQVIDNSINNIKLADMPANTVKVNNTSSLANPVDLTLPTNTVLARSGSTLEALSARNNTVYLRDNGNLRFVGGTSHQVLGFNTFGVLGFSEIIPVGSVIPIAGQTAPEGWLICDGTIIPDGEGLVQEKLANFSKLFTVLGTTYGATAGTLPDLRGYFVRGFGQAGLIGANSDGTVSGNFGQKVTDAFQGHKHGLYDPQHGHTGSTSVTGTHTHTLSLPDNSDQSSGGDAYSTTYIANNPPYGRSTSEDGDHSHTLTIVASSTNVKVLSPTGDQATPGSGDANGPGGATPRVADETRPKNVALLYCIKY